MDIIDVILKYRDKPTSSNDFIDKIDIDFIDKTGKLNGKMLLYAFHFLSGIFYQLFFRENNIMSSLSMFTKIT